MSMITHQLDFFKISMVPVVFDSIDWLADNLNHKLHVNEYEQEGIF